MELFFVRHAETDSNVAKRHQNEDSHLSSKGKLQAVAVAKKIKKINPTHIFVSDRVRALETAKEIAIATDLIPSVDAVFSELHRPKKIYGYKHSSVRSMIYLAQWVFGFNGSLEEDSEKGESYEALRLRMFKAKTILENMPADSRVVVISHSVFINMFIAHLNKHKKLSFVSLVGVFIKILTIKNSSISRLRYNKSNNPSWSLIDFNK